MDWEGRRVVHLERLHPSTPRTPFKPLHLIRSSRESLSSRKTFSIFSMEEEVLQKVHLKIIKRKHPSNLMDLRNA
jgi:hypothetical protein